MKASKRSKTSRKPRWFQAIDATTEEPIGMPQKSGIEALEEATRCGYRMFRRNSRGEQVQAVAVKPVY